MPYTVAGIDIHKKVLMVVVLHQIGGRAEDLQRRRFGTATSELHRLTAWLREQGVEEAVMESTAQYWKPVWYELEPHMRLQLAQAFSNRAPRGRKHDFRDAERLVRRLLAEELILSFVPPPEQRAWRMMTRAKVQLARDRVRLHNQLEGLLEEMRIKLSSVLSDLLGVSGLRILRALAEGETDAKKLAALGNDRLHCSEEQLVDALNGTFQPMHQRLLTLYLDRLQLLDKQIAELNGATAEAMREHGEAVVRLAEVPGFGADSAQQVIAEVGPQASTFPSAAQLASWVGTNPGRQESAEQNQSSRSAKGNKYVRRILTEAAQAAVKTKGSHFQVVFRRLLPRLGYQQALWAIAHRLCRLVWKILHEKVRYIEQGSQRDPRALKQRLYSMARSLRQLGYNVNLDIEPLDSAPATG
ncbi:MAG: transposase [Acidobacteriaceae bacterium]|jgi:transposase|nr:transposase [Acidobacteriaceae bacterium]MDX6460673.1 transposase [Acidobacteriaceae bacterium]